MSRDPAWRRYLTFWRRNVEADVDAELVFHLEMRARDYQARGFDPDAASHAAANRLGNLGIARDACLTIGHRSQRRMHRAQIVDAFVQDCRYAVRTLGKQRGWTAVAVITLALGIGASTAMFSVVDSLILHPLPYRDATRVASLWMATPRSTMVSPSAAVVDAWQHRASGLESIQQVSGLQVAFATETDVRLLNAAQVGAGFLRFAGVVPILGRGIEATDTLADSPAVVALSEGLWRSQFGAARSAIGQRIILGDKPYTIVGVMPNDLRLPFGALHIETWFPLRRDSQVFNRPTIARVARGYTIAQVSAELDSIVAQDPRTRMEASKYHMRLLSAGESFGALRRGLFLLSGAVLLLVLVACANVAHLMIARGAARGREMAVRGALGAGRVRIARQLMTESLVLGTIGCASGVLCGYLGTQALVALRPHNLDQLSLTHVNGRTLAVSGAVSIITALIFGMAAAFHAVRRSTSDALRATAGTGTPNKRAQRARGALVVTEMAMSAMLLVGAGLVTRTVVKLQHEDPGFAADNLYAVTIRLPKARYPNSAARGAFVDQVLDRARLVPGVLHATEAGAFPPLSSFIFGTLTGDAASSAKLTSVAENEAAPDYFSMIGAPVVAGATFTDGSAARNEVILSRGMADYFWPGQSAVGHVLHLEGEKRPLTVVGVVGNVPFGPLSSDRAEPLIYYPIDPADRGAVTSVGVRVSPGVDPRVALRGIVRGLDAKLPSPDVVNVHTALLETIASQRFTMTLLAAFSILAVVLSAVGLYGVIAYMVAQRTREIGIRIAIGATPRHIARSIAGSSIALSLGGLVVGLGAAAWGTRMFQSLLFGAASIDPRTYAGVALCLVAVALVASLVPMRRAMTIDPAIAMRGD